LTQLQIAVELTAPTFLIVLGAVALAAAIAFGWGARNVAQDIVESAYNRRDEARQKVQEQRQQQDYSTGATVDGTLGDEDRPSARPLRREE
jgi:hypothetical protein